jgi:hypothetical protein
MKDSSCDWCLKSPRGLCDANMLVRTSCETTFYCTGVVLLLLLVVVVVVVAVVVVVVVVVVRAVAFFLGLFLFGLSCFIKEEEQEEKQQKQ